MTARQGQGFPKAARLRRRREFLSFGRGDKRRTASFVLLVRDCDGPSRLGITVSRKAGGAVIRNGLKRRIREVFRRHPNRHRLGCDLVVIAKAGIGTLPTSVVEQQLATVLDSPRPRHPSHIQ